MNSLHTHLTPEERTDNVGGLTPFGTTSTASDAPVIQASGGVVARATVGHTALPWAAREGVHFHYIESADGCVAKINVSPLGIHEQRRADAAFIVLAANSHDALVDALNDCRQYLYAWRHEYSPQKTGMGPDNAMLRLVQASLVKMEAALTLAGAA